MPKVEFPVDKKKLLAAIEQAEKNGPLANQSSLGEAVAVIYNKMSPPREISFQVVLLRIRAWGLNIKTPKGKRGRQAGTKMTPEHKQALLDGRKGGRAAKILANPKFKQAYNAMRQVVLDHNKKQYLPLVELTIKGRQRAKDKLGCLFCTAFQTMEIKKCSDFSCPQWLTRPYQNIETTEDVSSEDTNFVENEQKEDVPA
jgi:hypothetical protein